MTSVSVTLQKRDYARKECDTYFHPSERKIMFYQTDISEIFLYFYHLLPLIVPRNKQLERTQVNIKKLF